MKVFDDVLEEIPNEELLNLREMYRDYKEAPYVYSFINTSIKWKMKMETPEDDYLKFYAPEGDWNSDGTFIVHMQVSFCHPPTVA